MSEAVVEHYRAWFSLMMRHIEAERLTNEEVDAQCGLADGQYSKLVAAFKPDGEWSKGARRAGAYVMFAMMNNLGFDMVLRVNAGKLAKLREKAGKSKRPKGMRGLGAHERGHHAPRDCNIRFGADQLRLNGKKGAEVTNRKLSPKQRRRNAKRAALIRWNDIKAAASNQTDV